MSTVDELRVSDYENAVKDYEEIVSGQNVRDFLFAISADAYDKYVKDIFDGAQDGFFEYNRYADEQALEEDAPGDYSDLTDASLPSDTGLLSAATRRSDAVPPPAVVPLSDAGLPSADRAATLSRSAS